MDEVDKELQFEENRQLLIDLNDNIGLLKTEIETTRKEYVAPKENVTVSGEVKVNTEKEVEVNNLELIKGWLEDLGTSVSTALKVLKPVTEVTVKNIGGAKTESVKVLNIADLAEQLNPIAEAIKNNKPVVKVTKQDVVFPTSPTKPVAVRLSNGKSFYEALTVAMAGGIPTVNGAVPVVNTDGSPIGGSTAEIFDIRNIEEDVTYKYFGFEERGGTNWRIMRKTLATSVFLYATGTTDYATNWTGKAGLSYT